MEHLFEGLLFVQIVSAFITAIEFSTKRYSAISGFFIGLLLGLLGIVVGLLIRENPTPEQDFIAEMDELDKLAFHGGITIEEAEKYKTNRRKRFEQYRRS